jgi:hypothetical protein
MVLVLVAALTAAQLPADAPQRESESVATPRARLAEVDTQLKELRGQHYDVAFPLLGGLFGFVPLVVAGVIAKDSAVSTGGLLAVLMLVGATVSIEIFSIVVLVKNIIGGVVRDARLTSLSIERGVIQREIESQERQVPAAPPPPAPPVEPPPPPPSF